MLLEDIIAYVKKKNLGLIQGNMIKSFLIYNNDKNWALKFKKNIVLIIKPKRTNIKQTKKPVKHWKWHPEIIF